MSIFLSYSRGDVHQADEWVGNLERFGYRVWIDRAGIRGGQQWNETIVRSIREAQALLLLLSPNSARSDHPGQSAVPARRRPAHSDLEKSSERSSPRLGRPQASWGRTGCRPGGGGNRSAGFKRGKHRPGRSRRSRLLEQDRVLAAPERVGRTVHRATQDEHGPGDSPPLRSLIRLARRRRR